MGQQWGGYGPPPSHGGYYMAPMPPPGPMVPRCSGCGYQGNMYMTAKVSTGGWIIFALLLLLCFPICWLGLLMREKAPQCPNCQQIQGAFS